MSIPNSFTIFSRISFLPNNLRHKIFAAKQFITQNANIGLLRIINTDPDTARIDIKKIPQDFQTWPH